MQKNTQLILSGSQSTIEYIRNEMVENNTELISLTPIYEKKCDPFKPKPLGMEPLVYFCVVFAAHFTADLAVDFTKRYINKNKHKVDVQVASNKESDKESND